MRSPKITRASSLICTIIATASASLLALIIVMSVVGLVHPRQVKLGLATETLEKQYDGIALTSNTVTIKYGQLLQGHSLTVNGYTELLDVGQKENVLDVTIKDSTGADVTKMYSLDFDYGTLTVTPRKISLVTETNAKTYDGSPLISSKISLRSGSLVGGDSVIVVGDVSITEVGSVLNQVPYYIANSLGVDVTSHYEITNVYGSLRINPKALGIKTEGYTKVYDGKGVVVDKWSYVGNITLAEGEKIFLTFSEFVDAGEASNTPKVLIIDSDGRNITDRYNISFYAGKIDIKGIPLTISTGSASKVYDGTPLSKKTMSITAGKLMSGHYIKSTIYHEAVNAGVTKNDVELVICDANGNDVTNCYDITYDTGDLTIQPKPITVSTASAKKRYDGTSLTSDGFSLIHGSLCGGHYIKFIGSYITELGVIANIPTSFIVYETASNGSLVDVTNNYRVTFSYGTLTVTN